jgi:hypothetical protein
MPSKKKARSQARKAKKEQTRQQGTISSDGNADPDTSSCNHLKLPENRTVEDFNEARALFEDFTAQNEAHYAKIRIVSAIRGEIGDQMLQADIQFFGSGIFWFWVLEIVL